jgi:hypothetical protein
VKINLQRSSWTRQAWVFLMLGLAAAAVPLLAQLGQQRRAKDFKYREPYEISGPRFNVTNRTRSFVLGAEGTYLSNNLWLLTGARLEYYAPAGNVTNLVAKAPECLLDLSNRVASSTGRLDLFGSQHRVFVRGNEGFIFFLTNSTLIVSNHVRTYIHPELLNTATP